MNATATAAAPSVNSHEEKVLTSKSKLFTKSQKPSSLSLPLPSKYPESITKVQSELEKRLGPRKVKSYSQFNPEEIKQVAEIVDELLDKGGINIKSKIIK